MNSSDEFEIDDLSEAEVELTAQDLLDLSPLPLATRAAPSLVAVNAAAGQTPTIASSSAPKIAPPAAASVKAVTEPKKSHAGAVLATVCVVVIAAVAAGVGVVFSKEVGAHKRPTMIAQTTIPERPDPVIEEEMPQLPPVRVKNPFDDSEVFELPAGTSNAEARAYVADVLLKRAAERRAMLDPRHR
jgi:hypothetical protein